MENTSEGDKKEPLFKEDEFAVVRHSYLNGNTYTPEDLMRTSRDLAKYTSKRPIVQVLEGDIIQSRNREPILTHQYFLPLTQNRVRRLREKHIASTLDEVIDKAAKFKERYPEERLVLCFEPKTITTEDTIYEAVRKLKEHGIKDAYFDSFFGDKLDVVARANKEMGTSYPLSWHLLANFGKQKIGIPFNSPNTQDIITVPYTNSFGQLATKDRPVIYGAVGSLETLERISADPNVKGAYVRLREGKGIAGVLKMLYNSMTNTEKLRRNYVLMNQAVTI